MHCWPSGHGSRWPATANGAVAAEVIPVACAQNGVESERVALRRFRHVYGIYVRLPATHLEPGTVEARVRRSPGCSDRPLSRREPTRCRADRG